MTKRAKVGVRFPPIADFSEARQFAQGSSGDFMVSWLWPSQLNPDDRISIRIVRLIHWCVVGFAFFGLVVSFIGLVEADDREPISYFAVGFMWLALAMLGRGLRYVVARE